MKQIKKAVIPAAGLGTRFLPATKSIPKEMLTIVDKPIILYNVEEAVKAGIEDIVIIAGRQKNEIEDFFDSNYELEDTLEKAGKTELLNKVNYLKDMCNIISIRQKQPLGLGHAVLCAQPIVGDEPFAVMLGDEIMIPEEGGPSAIGELNDIFHETQISTVAVMEVPEADVEKYGIIDFELDSNNLMKIKNVVEKPNRSKAPSRMALPGRYTFNASIFDAIKNSKPGKNGEIQLTDAMTTIAQSEGMYATTLSSRRFDAGDKFGYLQANIELALENPELGEQLKLYIKELAGKLWKLYSPRSSLLFA